jgi:hypothetical protein
MAPLTFAPFDRHNSGAAASTDQPEAATAADGGEKPTTAKSRSSCCSGSCEDWDFKPQGSVDILLLVSRISAFTISSCLLAIGLVYIQMVSATGVGRTDCILMLALGTQSFVFAAMEILCCTQRSADPIFRPTTIIEIIFQAITFIHSLVIAVRSAILIGFDQNGLVFFLVPLLNAIISTVIIALDSVILSRTQPR